MTDMSAEDFRVEAHGTVSPPPDKEDDTPTPVDAKEPEDGYDDKDD